MLHVVLYQPEIPPNTGNIIRLCANSGTQLHLIHPMSFQLDDKRLRRAGLDYHELAVIHQYHSLDEFISAASPRRLFACTTKASRHYSAVSYAAGDAVIFGPETRGLPAELLATLSEDQRLRIPMVQGSRSLNLSNAVAVVVYEAWRQQHFIGAD